MFGLKGCCKIYSLIATTTIILFSIGHKNFIRKNDLYFKLKIFLNMKFQCFDLLNF
jgi:hypothetical protein